MVSQVDIRVGNTTKIDNVSALRFRMRGSETPTLTPLDPTADAIGGI